MDQLTPAELEDLLAALRKHGVASAEVPTARGTLRVVLEPRFDADPLPGDAPTPGGWKSPPNLDKPQQYEEVP